MERAEETVLRASIFGHGASIGNRRRGLLWITQLIGIAPRMPTMFILPEAKLLGAVSLR
jgi:hypothetical protein